MCQKLEECVLSMRLIHVVRIQWLLFQINNYFCKSMSKRFGIFNISVNFQINIVPVNAQVYGGGEGLQSIASLVYMECN